MNKFFLTLFFCIISLLLFAQEQYPYRYGHNNGNATYNIRGLFDQEQIRWSIKSSDKTNRINPDTGKNYQLNDAAGLLTFEIYKELYIRATKSTSQPIYIRDIPAGMYTFFYEIWYSKFDNGQPGWYAARGLVDEVVNKSKYININAKYE